jgi:hypothetical protein
LRFLLHHQLVHALLLDNNYRFSNNWRARFLVVARRKIISLLN